MTTPLRMHRDASGRLTLELDRDYPSPDVDARVVKEVLATHFGAAFGERWEDPLGDTVTIRFQSRGQAFELGWDHWCGLYIMSLKWSGNRRLKRIAAYFEANPPPLKDAVE